MTRHASLRALAAAGLIVLTAGGSACSALAAAATKAAPFAPVEFPTPGKSTINRDKTIVVGSASQWFGTLSIDTDSNLNDAQQFYTGVMAAQGWAPLSSLIAERVVLQYIDRDQGRSVMISMDKKGGLMSGTHIEVVISPLILSAL